MPFNQKPNPRWTSYNAGKLRHRVLILRQTQQVDAIGAPQDVWITVLNTAAAIESDVISREFHEFYQDGMMASRVTHIITIRWTRVVPIVPGMRVMFVDQRFSPPVIHTYFVEFVENPENRDVLLLLGCWEINAPG